MAEFHIKNTDRMFNSTFGFTHEELKRGIVDLQRLRDMIYAHAGSWPVEHVTGYLEIGGPKLGRDYSDCRLEPMLVESLEKLKEAFGGQT